MGGRTRLRRSVSIGYSRFSPRGSRERGHGHYECGARIRAEDRRIWCPPPRRRRHGPYSLQCWSPSNSGLRNCSRGGKDRNSARQRDQCDRHGDPPIAAGVKAHGGVPVKIVCDSAAAQILSRGVVDKIVVGADRILKTGHVTNKIGTLPIALSAKFYDVPFYTAAPVSTLDMKTDPSMVVIEERPQREVLFFKGMRIGPRRVEALNPAFDVTPPELVSGVITDRGVAKPPLEESLRSLTGIV